MVVSNLNGNQTMKTTFRLIGAVATVAALFASCKKEAFNEDVKPGQVEMTIIAGADDTRTVLGDDGVVTWSSTGETLAVLENNGAKNLSSYTSKEGVSTDEGKTMSFDVTLDTETAASFASFDYYALYPSTSCVSDTYSDAKKIKVILSATQCPTATSFDPKSDILVSKPKLGLETRPSSLALQFARIVAIGKMTITNLNTEETVKKVSFTAKDKVVNGRSYINLEDASAVQYGYYAPSATVTLDYTEQSFAANGMTAYFTCWPFELVAGDSFSVEVETENYTFTKNIKLAEGKSLPFKVGEASEFSVNFDGIKGVKTEVDVTYAKLTATNFIDAGASNSYKLVTVTQDNGLSWDCYAYLSSDNFIQVRNCKQNEASKNDSYIKLPSFSKEIQTVTVTLGKAATAGASIFLSSTKDATSGDLSSLTASSALTYTFNLAGKGEKTAYLRCYGSTLFVESVEVIAGEDTRTALNKPNIVKAELSKDSANSIYVEWEAVENAGSYVVSATTEAGDIISKEVTTNSCTISGLASETTYAITVVAKPSDTTKFKESPAAKASETVTTGKVTLTSIEITLDSVTSLSSGYTSGTFTVNDVTFGFSNWIKSSPNIQAKASTTNSLYNSTALPGNIKKITVQQGNGKTARAITVYGGTSLKPTNAIKSPSTASSMEFDFSGNKYTFFSIKTPSNAVYFYKITIELE